MHSAHGWPYSRVHAQIAAHSASWLSASVKHMVINPLSFACFRDPSPLSRGAQFGGNLSRDQADLRRRGFGTDQHRKAQLDACRMAKRILGFLLLLLISPLKALPGAKPLAKSDPGEKKKTHPNTSWMPEVTWCTTSTSAPARCIGWVQSVGSSSAQLLSIGRKEGLKSSVIEYKCKDKVTGKDKYKPGTREQVKNCSVDWWICVMIFSLTI